MADERQEGATSTPSQDGSWAVQGSGIGTTAEAASERGNEEAAPRFQAAAGQPIDAATALAMRALRNARYHEDREGYFAALNRWSNFLAILLGSGAFAGGAAHSPWLAMTGGLAAAAVSAGRLVFDFGGKTYTHRDLKRSFLEIFSGAQVSEADVTLLNRRMVDIYRNEPEIYHAVNSLAYNAVQVAFERPPSTFIAVSARQKMFRHLRRFDPSDFPDVSGREPSRA